MSEAGDCRSPVEEHIGVQGEHLGIHKKDAVLSGDEAPNNEVVEDLSYQAMHNPRQGGYKPVLFVFVLMLLDNISFVANMPVLNHPLIASAIFGATKLWQLKEVMK